MELLNFLSQVPIPVLILVIAVLVVVTAVVVYQYAKAKGLDGIRKEVYKLFLHAEHIYKESGQGEKKLKSPCKNTVSAGIPVSMERFIAFLQ